MDSDFFFLLATQFTEMPIVYGDADEIVTTDKTRVLLEIKGSVIV